MDVKHEFQIKQIIIPKAGKYVLFHRHEGVIADHHIPHPLLLTISFYKIYSAFQDHILCLE